MNEVQGWGFGRGDGSIPERVIQPVRIGTMKEGRWASLVRGEHPHSRSDRDYYVRELPDQEPTAFSGHRLMHEITFEDRNYLKESFYSGEEFRKSGTCVIKINGYVCDSFSYREVGDAIAILPSKLNRIKDFGIQLWDEADRAKVVGRRIYCLGTPAIITRFIEDQASVIVKIDDGDRKDFPLLPHEQEDKKEAEAAGREFSEFDLDRMRAEDGRHEIKIGIFCDWIWWHRS